MFYLLIILFFSFILRQIGINWDLGGHLHPDERMLIMVTEKINFFSQLNPEFFNYGSLPIYLLRGTSQIIDNLTQLKTSDYNGLLYTGRYLSLFFDLGTIILIYKIAKHLSQNHKIALLSSFLYGLAFFPIQNTHFFVVDVFLTFFTTLLIYLLLRMLKTTNSTELNKYILFLGITFAATLATKFTAIIFYPFILVLLFLKSKQLGKKILVKNFLLLNVFSFTFFFLFMPYAILSFTRYFSDIKEQTKMSSDPYIFPYTLQYVGTLPYIYFLKNIFLWGLGPIISLLSIVGSISIIRNFIANKISIKSLLHGFTDFENKISGTVKQWCNFLVFFLFYFFYFLIIGRSAVKFMRYMLPLYPFFVIMGAYGLTQIKNSKLNLPAQARIKNLIVYGLLILMTLWTLMFLNIYLQKHTRIAATEWILKNIPSGSTLAREHWDDGIPLTNGENYTQQELTLYDTPDDDLKWEKQNDILNQSAYLIIASNRLYTPLQKLSDCTKYKSCYPKTAAYYKKLFANELEFKKVAEFSAYPQLKIGAWKLEIKDDSADESFTVYDHPKIIIFKKI